MFHGEDEVDDIISEISILSGMHSPYVTKYYGSYQHGTELWIVMEFCSGGSCADLMRPGPIDESEIAVILKELLMADTLLVVLGTRLAGEQRRELLIEVDKLLCVFATLKLVSLQQ